MIPDFDHERMVRMIHIHAQMRRMFQDIAARLPHDRRGIKRIPLIRTPGKHLERAGQRLHHPCRLFTDRAKVFLLHLNSGADGVHAEHTRHAADTCIHIVKIRYINPSLAQPHTAA